MNARQKLAAQLRERRTKARRAAAGAVVRALTTSAPASDHLVGELPKIAASMVLFARAGSDDSVSELVRSSPEALRELGGILTAILRGESANKLFRQDKRSKPSGRAAQFNAAFVYEFTRAGASDVADDSTAVEAARRVLRVAPVTIRDYAKANRARVWDAMRGRSPAQLGEHFAMITGAIPSRETTPDQVERLRAYYGKKGRRNPG